MAEYRFSTLWCIAAPLDPVCAAIEHSLHWPIWWPCVEKVEEIESGNAQGIGSIRRYTWKGLFPYRLTFDIRVSRAKPRVMVEGIASGELEGIGQWRFAEQGVITLVRHEWHIRTTKRWMNLLAPAARPLFAWNHHYIMRRGENGLTHWLTRQQHVIQR